MCCIPLNLKYRLLSLLHTVAKDGDISKDQAFKIGKNRKVRFELLSAWEKAHPVSNQAENDDAHPELDDPGSAILDQDSCTTGNIVEDENDAQGDHNTADSVTLSKRKRSMNE